MKEFLPTHLPAERKLGCREVGADKLLLLVSRALMGIFKNKNKNAGVYFEVDVIPGE